MKAGKSTVLGLRPLGLKGWVLCLLIPFLSVGGLSSVAGGGAQFIDCCGFSFSKRFYS